MDASVMTVLLLPVREFAESDYLQVIVAWTAKDVEDRYSGYWSFINFSVLIKSLVLTVIK
jgi:hypothetical protein